MAVSYKAKYILIIWPSNPMPRNLALRNENLFTKTNRHIYSSCISNCPKLDNPNILQWINKLWYNHTLEYHSLMVKNKLLIYTHLDESHRHYIEWKKPVQKVAISKIICWIILSTHHQENKTLVMEIRVILRFKSGVNMSQHMESNREHVWVKELSWKYDCMSLYICWKQ